jgi:phage terminase large subunit GpA-like protein
MLDLSRVGADWIIDEVNGMTDNVKHITPTAFNEENRYLPESVTSIPGYIRYDVNPFMREIVDCFDIDSPVREVNLKKGVQITYSTVLESGALYYMAHIKSLPIMYLTADKELASARIENNFLPMLSHSGLAHIIRSSDAGNSRKTGKTSNHLQFEGGGYLVPFGAKNADKMRSYSIAIMLKDEIDAWPDVVGKDGDPDSLSDDRCSGYWERRKIFRGSTPLIKESSKIEMAYKRGDQRVYTVLCKKCSFPQRLRWKTEDRDTGVVGGFMWDMEENSLILESVRYCCQSCGEAHYEHDKEKLFSPDHGAHWKPTARPVEPEIRSYHLPALYSPIGMQPWYKCVSSYMKGFDVKENRVSDIAKYQVFYNNILAEPFEIRGFKIQLSQVSYHRCTEYVYGNINNSLALSNSGSKVIFLTCQVDVHKNNLAVAVVGWCREQISYLIDYWRFEVKEGEADCTELSSPAWDKLRDLIENKVYVADDGIKYSVRLTLIDSGYAADTVTSFCGDYASGVIPIVGRDRPSKYQKITEFSEFTTKSGDRGYMINVDHYKDRLATVLRREWVKDSGCQRAYHFNTPNDVTTKQLKELTVESKKKKTDDRGIVSYMWHRPSGADNELWDLMVYAHAAVEIIAYNTCIVERGMESVEWGKFWDYAEQTFLEI